MPATVAMKMGKFQLAHHVQYRIELDEGLRYTEICATAPLSNSRPTSSIEPGLLAGADNEGIISLAEGPGPPAAFRISWRYRLGPNEILPEPDLLHEPDEIVE